MLIEIIGSFSSPALIVLILIFALKNKIDIFDSFKKGALEGLECMVSILPAIVALITAVTMFKSSGAMDFLTKSIQPAFDLFGVPAECLPLLIMKPISGSGSNAILNSIFSSNGPDSYVGKLSSIISGSDEAIFYIVSTYCSPVKVENKGEIILCALVAFLCSIICSFFIC